MTGARQLTGARLHFGFMQYPTIAEGLALAGSQGKLPGIDLSDVTLHRPRNHHSQRGHSRDVAVAGNAVCLPAAQCRALGRVFRRSSNSARSSKFGNRVLAL
jgi:hypothetical protein